MASASGRSGRRVLLLGGTGTAGRATLQALLEAGHEVVAVRRPTAAESASLLRPTRRGRGSDPHRAPGNGGLDAAVTWRAADVLDADSLRRDGLCGEQVDAVISCLASRTGVPDDAWAIDYQAQRNVLEVARAAGARHVVLLSAICVQKPRLAFQHAKLAFERELIGSGLDWTIVRPTAFFKSLSGQVERVRAGKPFLVFGDGRLTACKPIGDADLGRYLADCLENPGRRNRILPIGGPGAAITPREQGERLFELMGRRPRFREVPVGLLVAIRWTLEIAGRIHPKAAAKAELARIGQYYATESMLLLDPATGRYDAEATPSTGTETLFDFYARLLDGRASVERGEHAVF